MSTITVRPGSPLRSRPLLTLLATAILAGTPLGLRAQSGLEQVEQLTRMGRTEEAREALLSWWEEDRGDASRRELQRGLWLRGRLTVDPVQAELDFRRLAVLYPSGQFTPDALMRLAQSSFAMGDEDGARNYVATLVRDYPRSEARQSAEAWLADAGPVPPAGDTPTRATATAGVTTAPSAGRDEPAAGDVPEEAPPAEVIATDTSVGDPEPDAGDRPPAEGEVVMNYYVQLGAFAEEERAVSLSEEVREQGVDVRVVRVEGSRFTHVRVGRFADRAAAVELLEELTAQGISAALVRDDRAEQPIGG
jgi:cell division septation protein DedD